MAEIVTLRLKKEDREHIARLIRLGKYRSQAQILREGLRILKDREQSTALSKLILSKPKLKTTLEEVIVETDENWVSKGESGAIIDEMRERQ